jgi:hypothetical protein
MSGALVKRVTAMGSNSWVRDIEFSATLPFFIDRIFEEWRRPCIPNPTAITRSGSLPRLIIRDQLPLDSAPLASRLNLSQRSTSETWFRIPLEFLHIYASPARAIFAARRR